MTSRKFSRRLFLKGLGVALLLGGCSSELTQHLFEPTATPLPTPTPTPLPSADGVVQLYLSSWNEGDYETMYSLLTPESQGRINLAQFRNIYTHTLAEATVEDVMTQIQSLLQEQDRASAAFLSTWQTRLFNDIQANNQIHLRFMAGYWGVEWQPTLILPQLGEGVDLEFLSEQPTRGNIYDRNLHALATQGQVVIVGVIPHLLENEETVIEYLASLSNLEPEEIRSKIVSAKPNWFVPITSITFETSLEHDNLMNNLSGIERRARDVRTYNDGETASHIIGYMGAIPADQEEEYLERGYNPDEIVGLAGVEGYMEEDLAGTHGGRLVTLSPSRKVLSEIATVPTEAGKSVYLTFDTTFQATVERLLGERLGAIVVMNPHLGDIYAAVSYPRFKPMVFTSGFNVESWTELYTNEDRPLVNRATQGVYPPGSIFKIVTMSAGLEAIGLQPEQTFVCTGKWDGLGENFVKACWLKSGHGQINMLEGLTQSCDVVFYEVGLALHKNDPQLLPDWARAFGLGIPTDILGVGESSGIVPDNAWKQARLNEPLFDGDAVNSAIGQGYMLATPLQVTRMMAAMANGGRLIRPRIISRIVDIDGNEERIEPEEVGSLPISPETLKLLQNSLEAVVSGARGTARAAFQGVSYTVAGKTGTSESGQEEPHAWFSGYAPVDKPEVAITVILEHAGEGSKEAAPLFRQVVEAFFAWQAGQS